MTHDVHAGPERAVLFDSCGECSYRSEHPDVALSHMDPQTFAKAWTRAVAWNRGELSDATAAEIPVLRILHAVACCLERRGFPYGPVPVGQSSNGLDAILADALTPLPDIASWAGGPA